MAEGSRPVDALPTGTAVARYIQALALGVDDMYAAVQKAETWRDTPTVLATIKLRTKAAVAAGTTSDATWAGPLAAYGVASEAISILRGLSIFGALAPRMRQVPFHTKVAVETGTGITGAWIAEGAPVPFHKTAYATSIEEFYRFGDGYALSEELVTTSDPAAVPEINSRVLGGLAKGIDTQLLTPTVALSAGVNPASILNGSTEITTTGTTSAQMSADLAGMMAAVTTPGPYVWIMRPKTMGRIALTLGSQAPDLPRTLFSSPVIASINSPAQIALLDPSAVMYSDAGRFDLSASRYPLVDMSDAPANPTVAGTVMTSMYQRNDVAVKALRWLAWLNLSPTTSASFMTVAY